MRRTRSLIVPVLEYSLLLPVGAIAALIWANTLAVSYAQFVHACEFVVNDVGMAFFFALAAKEVVEATVPGGPLHTWRRAAMPVAAAAGGMIGPALIYLAMVLISSEPALARLGDSVRHRHRVQLSRGERHLTGAIRRSRSCCCWPSPTMPSD